MKTLYKTTTIIGVILFILGLASDPISPICSAIGGSLIIIAFIAKESNNNLTPS